MIGRETCKDSVGSVCVMERALCPKHRRQADQFEDPWGEHLIPTDSAELAPARPRRARGALHGKGSLHRKGRGCTRSQNRGGCSGFTSGLNSPTMIHEPGLPWTVPT